LHVAKTRRGGELSVWVWEVCNCCTGSKPADCLLRLQQHRLANLRIDLGSARGPVSGNLVRELLLPMTQPALLSSRLSISAQFGCRA